MSNLVFFPPPACCAHCKQTGLPLQKCSSCGVAHYCSFSCKKEDSSCHMSLCISIRIQREEWFELYRKNKKEKTRQAKIWQGNWLPMVRNQIKLANAIVGMGSLYDDYRCRYMYHQAIAFYHNALTVAKWGGPREGTRIYSILCPGTLRAIQSQLLFLLTYIGGNDHHVMSMMQGANVTDDELEYRMYPKLGPSLNARHCFEDSDIKHLHSSVKFILYFIKSKMVGEYHEKQDQLEEFKATHSGGFIEQVNSVVKEFLIESDSQMQSQMQQLHYLRAYYPSSRKQDLFCWIPRSRSVFSDLTPEVFDTLLDQAMTHLPRTFVDYSRTNM